VALFDVPRDGVELAFLRLEDEVLLVLASDRDVRRDLDDVQVVDLDELLLLRLRRAGHAGELVVEAEVVLQRDGGERLVLLLDADALLRLDRLMQALAPAAAFHHAPRELIDDLHLVVLDHVVDVAVVERLCFQRLVEVVHELRVLRCVEVLDPQRAFDLRDALFRDGDGLVLLVVLVVGAGRFGGALLVSGVRAVADQLRRDACEVVVDLRSLLGLARDDERCARLVDQDRVDLVHDRVRVPTLHEALEGDAHVVAQIVEAELRVRAVGDIGLVGGLAWSEGHHVLDVGGAHAEHGEDGLGPGLVALCEVVVRRHEMHAVAGERVQVHRLRRDEGLSLAGLHLGDVALVEDDAAHQLHVEEPDVHRALEGLAHSCERLEEELVEVLAIRDALFELRRLGGDLLVAQLLEFGLERRDVRRLLLEALATPAFADAEDFFERTELLGHASRVAIRGLRP
jgi:hypothetical protein